MTPLEEFLLKTIREADGIGEPLLLEKAGLAAFESHGDYEFSVSLGRDKNALSSLMAKNLIGLKDGMWEAVDD